MASKDFTDFKEVDNQVIYTGNDKLVLVVPEIYFGGPNGVVKGETILLLGIFTYFVEGQDGSKKSGLRNFYLPSIFSTTPRKVVKQKDVKLTKNTSVQDYRFLYYEKNDKVIANTNIPEMISNTEAFMKLFFINGHVTETVSYREMLTYMLDNIKLSGEDYQIDPHLLDIIPAEICRDAHDPSWSFRHSKEFKNGNMYGYMPTSMLQLPKYVSPAINISSRYWDDSVMQSMIMNGDDIQDSPMEDVFFLKNID